MYAVPNWEASFVFDGDIQLRERELYSVLRKLGIYSLIDAEVHVPVIGSPDPCAHDKHYAAVLKGAERNKRVGGSSV